MFKDNLDRVCAFCFAEFEPRISHLGRQHAALEAAQRHFGAKQWQVRPASVLLQDQDGGAIFQLDLRRAFFQTLGMDSWKKEDLVAALIDGLRELGVEKLLRAAFVTRVFMSLGMSHTEMVALLPGTFLGSRESLKSVIGQLDDAYVQLHGIHEGLKLTLMVAPMNSQDTESTFLGTNSLNLFVKNPLLDRRISEFRSKMGNDATFFIEVQLLREELGVDDLRTFVNQCVEGVEAVSDSAIRQLKSLRPKR